MLIICDFDGTVTARDTNSALARRFAPDAYAGVEGRLASRELTLREVLTAEFMTVTASLEEVLDEARRIPFRAGFGRLLDQAQQRGITVVLLSSGFREIIEPLLEFHGVGARVELIAHSIAFGPTGARITWRDLPMCDLCGEQCKRYDVAQLRERHAPNGETVVYVGDGFSDRCGGESGDRVFARDGLATYLRDAGIEYDAWEDFDQVAEALGLVHEVTG